MMLSYCQPAVPLFFFFFFFYKEDNNADSVLPAGERRKGRVKGGQREQGLKKKKKGGGGIMGQRGTSMGEAGEGLLSRRTEGYWQNHKFHKAERSSGGPCVSWSAVVAG